MLSLFLAVIDDHSYDALFEKIYEEYKERLYNYARKITKDDDMAQQVVQDTFYKIAGNIASLKVEDPILLKSYLYRITHNKAIDHIRKNKNRFIYVENYDYISSDNEIDIEDELASAEQYDRLVEIIFKLPDKYSDVLVLYYLQELTTKQIANILCRKEGTVRQQLLRGNNMLKECLEEEGIHD